MPSFDADKSTKPSPEVTPFVGLSDSTRPTMTSLPLVPMRRLLPGVPVLVAGRSKQVAAAAYAELRCG